VTGVVVAEAGVWVQMDGTGLEIRASASLARPERIEWRRRVPTDAEKAAIKVIRGRSTGYRDEHALLDDTDPAEPYEAGTYSEDRRRP
jgi:hypothetical protein